MIFKVFIGYDRDEDTAAQVCRQSLLDHASIPVDVQFLDQQKLRRAGLYTRPFFQTENQWYDVADRRPFSTEFTFTRFLVPALCQWNGRALFCDSDMLWRADIKGLLSYNHFSVRVVKHDYQPKESRKMRGGKKQEPYPKKNWSSFMLFNCDRCENLTPHMVNTFPGSYLHGFKWLHESQIGDLPIGWNWLDGHSPPDILPKVVHFTRGTPDVPGYEGSPYADEWWRIYGGLKEVA